MRRRGSQLTIAFSSGLALSIGAAAAADLPRKAPAAVAASPVHNWTGLYVGLHAGWGWANARGTTAISSAFVDDPGPFDLGGNGGVGGAQIGFNWQVAPSVVLGLEADISGTGIRGAAFQPGSTFGTLVPGWQHHMNRDVEWLATVRGRAGFAWDRALLYATGGLAFGHVTDEAFTTAGTVLYPFSSSATRAGWTVGAGLEWAFSPNWSARVEYLYTQLDHAHTVVAPGSLAGETATYAFEDVKLHVVRAGVNYRFGGGEGAARGELAARGLVSWAGFYLGAHAGYGWADTDANIPGVAFLYDPAAFSLSGDGIIGGGQVGYNWHVTPGLVLGVEADFSGTGIDDQVLAVQTLGGAPRPAGFSHFMSRDINWLLTVRGRVGYAFDRVLVYATGGAAWGSVSYEAATSWNGIGFTPAAFTETRAGWTLGGGLEWAVSGNWSARLEYLHYRLDGTDIATPGLFGFTAAHNWDDTRINVVRAGLSYRFGASPVVAKY